MEDEQNASPLADFLTLARKLVPEDAPTHAALPQAQVEAQNEASLQALGGMLAGLHKR